MATPQQNPGEATMPKSISLDTFLVTLKVPRDLPAANGTKIRRTLNRTGFQTRLRQAVEAAVKQFPTLQLVTVSVSR
jgi:hypothetical protein